VDGAQDGFEFHQEKDKTEEAYREGKAADIKYCAPVDWPVSRGQCQVEPAGLGSGAAGVRAISDSVAVVRAAVVDVGEKSRLVVERILSLHRPYMRPLVRSKGSRKVEVALKAALTHAGGSSS